MGVKEEKQAALLNNAHILVHKAHESLKWVNFLTPDKEDLSSILEDIHKATATIQRVIDGQVFDGPRLVK